MKKRFDFVDVTLQNRGSTDLGGEAVPLYLRDKVALRIDERPNR